MSDNNSPGNNPEDEFQEMLRRFLGASGAAGNIDPEQFARMSGMQLDPAMMQQIFQQLQGAFSGQAGGEGGFPWHLAASQAATLAERDARAISSRAQQDVDGALALADLWLSEVTQVAALTEPAGTITPKQWVEYTLPVWQELAEPVAGSITDALRRTLQEQTPEEMKPLIAGAGSMLRQVGGSLFATQLGQVVGRLATEVLSGGDVGLPVMPVGKAALLPQNFATLGDELEVPEDQLALYLAARELAHARLFRHAKWLRLDVITQVTEFARGISVDSTAMEELAERFDPTQPEELRQALESGALLPKHTEQQELALSRLEHTLAVIEGWVDVVTQDATARLPRAAAIAEIVRRRRATGGPAERALGSLVGLEVRPRRLREAAAMWRALTDELGVAERDALWDYADFVPTPEDIDNPTGLVVRVRERASGDAVPVDELDEAIARILSGETGDEPADDEGQPGEDRS